MRHIDRLRERASFGIRPETNFVQFARGRSVWHIDRLAFNPELMNQRAAIAPQRRAADRLAAQA